MFGIQEVLFCDVSNFFLPSLKNSRKNESDIFIETSCIWVCAAANETRNAKLAIFSGVGFSYVLTYETRYFFDRQKYEVRAFWSFFPDGSLKTSCRFYLFYKIGMSDFYFIF